MNISPARAGRCNITCCIVVINFVRKRVFASLTLCKRENGSCARQQRKAKMNTIKKMILGLAVCGALCTTAMAAPKGGAAPQGKASTMQRSAQVGRQQSQGSHVSQAPDRSRRAPVKQSVSRPQPKQQTAHQKPASHPQMRHERPEHDGCRHGSTLHTGDWCSIGASLIGGLVGGLIGSAM